MSPLAIMSAQSDHTSLSLVDHDMPHVMLVIHTVHLRVSFKIRTHLVYVYADQFGGVKSQPAVTYRTNISAWSSVPSLDDGLYTEASISQQHSGTSTLIYLINLLTSICKLDYLINDIDSTRSFFLHINKDLKQFISLKVAIDSTFIFEEPGKQFIRISVPVHFIGALQLYASLFSLINRSDQYLYHCPINFILTAD